MIECFELKIRCKTDAEIITEMTQLFDITAATQDVNSTAEKIASKATKICIIYMHYLSVIETNINFRRQQMS